jgi:hypothetical protein
MAANPIRGKVARILNSRELILNVGSSAGVVVGLYFDILDPKGEDIRDPDTDEVLGSIERPKVRVQVTKVDEKLCVASTYKKRQVNVGGRGFGVQDDFARMLAPPKYVTQFETLKTTEKTWENLSEEQSYVKIGDPAVQVIEEIDVGRTTDG